MGSRLRRWGVRNAVVVNTAAAEGQTDLVDHMVLDVVEDVLRIDHH